MSNRKIFSSFIFLVICGVGFFVSNFFSSGFLFFSTLALAFLFSTATNIANQWEKAVVLRLGKFNNERGPGFFWIIPIIDTIAYWIDTRVIPTNFKAERTLTKDTVPVNVDAVLFWKVIPDDSHQIHRRKEARSDGSVGCGTAKQIGPFLDRGFDGI